MGRAVVAEMKIVLLLFESSYISSRQYLSLRYNISD